MSAEALKAARDTTCASKEKKYPAAMLVKELRTGVLDGRKWTYCGSPVMNIDEEKGASLR